MYSPPPTTQIDLDQDVLVEDVVRDDNTDTLPVVTDEQGHPVPIEEKQVLVLNKHSPIKNMLIMLSLSFGGLHLGYYIAIFNPMSGPLFTDIYKLDEDTRLNVAGNIFMIFNLGGLCGSFVSGKLMELVGRRWCIFLIDILSILVILMYSMESIYILQLTRFLSGFVGCCTVMNSAVVMQEILPKEISGVGNSMISAVKTTSVFVAYIQQNLFSRETLVKHWRIFMCWPLILTLLRTIVFMSIVRTRTAKAYIAKHYGSPDMRSDLKYILSATHRESRLSLLVDECIKTHEMHATNHGKTGGYSRLFGQSTRRRLGAACLIAIAEQLSGMPVFALYSTDLFNKISNNGKEVTFSIAVAKVFGGIIAIFAIKYYGRKINIMAGTIMQCLCLLAIGISIEMDNTLIPYAAVFIFVIFYATGLGANFYVYAAEILDPLGVSIAGTVLGAVSAIVSKGTPYLFKYAGEQGTITAFAVGCLVCFVLLDYFIIETKGKGERQIVGEFLHKKYRFLDFS